MIFSISVCFVFAINACAGYLLAIWPGYFFVFRFGVVEGGIIANICLLMVFRYTKAEISRYHYSTVPAVLINKKFERYCLWCIWSDLCDVKSEKRNYEITTMLTMTFFEKGKHRKTTKKKVKHSGNGESDVTYSPIPSPPMDG